MSGTRMQRSDLPHFDALWDYSQPAKTEQTFRHVLQQTLQTAPAAYRAELWTQIARAQGLQRQFDAAHATLDQVERQLATACAADVPAGAEAAAAGHAADVVRADGGAADAAHARDFQVVRVRYLLERGRVFNSSRQPERARPLFLGAWELARRIGRDDYAVDAAHMLGIIEPPAEAQAWNERAYALAESSPQPGARRWRASLANNLGWACHARGEYGRALELFERALRLRQEQGDRRLIHVARWCVARCLRSLGRVEEALAMQRELEADEQHSEEPGYTFEELGECLLALGQADEARPCLARAFERLSRDAGFAEREPQRLERLRRLAAGDAG